MSTVKIPLNGKYGTGLFALVDEADVPKVSAFKWYVKIARRSNYTLRYAYTGHCGTIMHRLILGLPFSEPRVDHQNHDGLDNRRENLRIATPMQNAVNVPIHPRQTGRFRGVYPRERKWRAGLVINKHVKWLGTFNTEEEAAMRYNVAARQHRGEFAALNPVNMG